MQCAAAFAQDVDGATRAQRDAANPLRMIIEAGKLKPRKGGEGEPAAAAAVDAKAPAAKPAPAKAAAPHLGTLTDVATPDLTAVSAEATTIALVSPVALQPRPYDPDDYFGVAPPIKNAAAAAALPPVDAARAPSASSAVAPLRAPLQLAEYVEPQVPDRVRRRLPADAEVVLEFTVNPDGSVADLNVRSASDRALEQIAIDAVRQWRYQPIAAAQAHVVQLVFKQQRE